MSSRASRILIVEDDPTLRELLAEVMTDEGHQVRVVTDGSAGVDEIGTWQPDLVLLDLLLPQLDAIEEHMRDRPRGDAAGGRVLLVSAARDIEDAAARLRADAWLRKPFSLAEVTDTVNRLLAGELAGDR